MSGGQPSGYRYRRDERLSRPGAPRAPVRRGGFLRGNRMLLILLADVLLVTFVALALRSFLPGPADQAELAGFSLALSTRSGEDLIEVRLEVRRLPSADRGRESAGRVFARFALQGGPGRDGALQDGYPSDAYASAELPRQDREAVVLQANLLRPAERGSGGLNGCEVLAEVRIGEELRLLTRSLSSD